MSRISIIQEIALDRNTGQEYIFFAQWGILSNLYSLYILKLLPNIGCITRVA